MYRAIKTFAGNKIAMKKGDIKEYMQKEIAEDLLRAGYIEEIKEATDINVATIEVEPAKVEIKKEVVEEVKEVEKPKRTTTRKKK